MDSHRLDEHDDQVLGTRPSAAIEQISLEGQSSSDKEAHRDGPGAGTRRTVAA